MVYVARKVFTGNGVQYLPGDIVPDVDSYPRPESVIRAGYVVLKDVEPEVEDEQPETDVQEPEVPEKVVTEPAEVKPVRATRKPKE